MQRTLGKSFPRRSWTRLLDCFMPGGPHWDEHASQGGKCLRSCPAFRRCRGFYGPDGWLCTNQWRKAVVRPDNLAVLLHVLDHFDHYNRGDIRRLNTASAAIQSLRERVLELAEEAGGPTKGERRLRAHRIRETRSGAARKLKVLALASKKVVCAGCRTDWYRSLGPASASLIECHHRAPLAGYRPGGRVGTEEFLLLCANCHRLLHSAEIDRSIEKLRRLRKRR